MGTEVAERCRVGGVGGENGDGRWGLLRATSPLKGLVEFGRVSTSESDGFERRGRGIEEFESFSDDVFAGETRSTQDYQIERRIGVEILGRCHGCYNLLQ